jgi:hypothetical protein
MRRSPGVVRDRVHRYSGAGPTVGPLGSQPVHREHSVESARRPVTLLTVLAIGCGLLIAGAAGLFAFGLVAIDSKWIGLVFLPPLTALLLLVLVHRVRRHVARETGRGPTGWGRYSLTLVRVAVIEDAFSLTALIIGIVAVAARSLGFPSKDPTAYLVGVATSVVTLWARLLPKFGATLAQTIRAAYVRRIRRLFLDIAPETIVLGYGALGRRAISEIFAHRDEADSRRQNSSKLPRVEVIPEISELLLMQSRVVSRPDATNGLLVRLETDVLVADKTSDPFFGIVKLTDDLSMGLALVGPVERESVGAEESGARESHPGTGYPRLIPAIIGDATKRVVLDSLRIHTSRVFVDATGTEESSAALVRHYPDLFDRV